MSGYKATLETHVTHAAKLAGNLFRSRYGLWVLGLISFAESALVIPLITDPFLVAHILANHGRVWRAVVVATVTSVLGGIVAYTLAAAFFEFVAAHYLIGENSATFIAVADQFQQNTFALTLIGAVTPLPYTIVALFVGFVEGSLWFFILASVMGRGGRYILVGLLTKRYGEHALLLVKKRMHIVTLVLVVVSLLYFVTHV